MKINLGQGQLPEEGFEGCDQFKWNDSIKHVFDLRGKFPFDDNSIEEVRARQILEHFAPGDDLFHVLSEIHRVLVPGGRLEFWVPKYPDSIYCFLPDHLSIWTEIFVWALDTDYQKRGFNFKIDTVDTLVHPEQGNVDVHGVLIKR